MTSKQSIRWGMVAAAAVLMLVPLTAQDALRIPITPAASYVSDASPAGDALAAFLSPDQPAPLGAQFESQTVLLKFIVPTPDYAATEVGDATNGYQVSIGRTDEEIARFAIAQPVIEAISARPEGVTELPTNLNQALSFWSLLATGIRPASAVEISVDGYRGLISIIPNPTEPDAYLTLAVVNLGESYTVIGVDSASTTSLTADLQTLAVIVNSLDLDGDGKIAPAVVAPEATLEPEATVEPEATAIVVP